MAEPHRKVRTNEEERKMQLIQRNNNGFPAQILPNNDNEIITGPMGDCVSVIVLYNLNAHNVFQHARGYHGGGGLGNVNFASLFGGVPNVHTTRIIVVSGTLQTSQFAQQTNRETIRQEANDNGLGNAYIQCYDGFGNTRVTRNGNIARV
jgi:hypothetical protein